MESAVIYHPQTIGFEQVANRLARKYGGQIHAKPSPSELEMSGILIVKELPPHYRRGSNIIFFLTSDLTIPMPFPRRYRYLDLPNFQLVMEFSQFRLTYSFASSQNLLVETNFIYPTAVLRPDIDYTEGGWLSRNILSTLHQSSPKFKQLIKLLLSGERQLVYIQPKARAGFRLFQALLNYLGLNYESLEATESELKQRKIILNFNFQSTSQVLLAATIPVERLTGIRAIHFVETPTWAVYQQICSKIDRTRKQKEVSVHLHVCQVYDSRSQLLLGQDQLGLQHFQNAFATNATIEKELSTLKL